MPVTAASRTQWSKSITIHSYSYSWVIDDDIVFLHSSCSLGMVWSGWSIKKKKKKKRLFTNRVSVQRKYRVSLYYGVCMECKKLPITCIVDYEFGVIVIVVVVGLLISSVYTHSY